MGSQGDCSQLAPRLFCGSAVSAADSALLRHLGVTLVVNVADDLVHSGHKALAQTYEDEWWREFGALIGSEWWRRMWRGTHNGGVRRLSCPLKDSPSSSEGEALGSELARREMWMLEEVVRAMQDGSGGAVLVHCVAGINRSATISCAALMLCYRCTYLAAITWVQQARPICKPCPEYVCALLALDTALRAQGAPLLERIELPVPSGAGAIGVFHEEPAGVGAEETDAVQEKAWPPPAPDTEPAKERPGSPGSPGSPLPELLSARARAGPITSDRTYSNAMTSIIEVDFPLGTIAVDGDDEEYDSTPEPAPAPATARPTASSTPLAMQRSASPTPRSPWRHGPTEAWRRDKPTKANNVKTCCAGSPDDAHTP